MKEFLKKSLLKYNEKDFLLIKKALFYAMEKHKGQFRKSGEEYIVHPIAVASMLIDLEASANTVCAGLLHDIIEDTDTKKEDIMQEFNLDIANLVEAVTKIKNKDQFTKEEEKALYIRKVTTSILTDIRVIIIKLIDRLHNIQTLEYKSRESQIRIANETLELYVPIAYYLGIYKLRFLLEDLSFKYLNNELYNKIGETRKSIIDNYGYLLDDMIDLIRKEFTKYCIKAEFTKDTKNIYGIYKRINNGTKLEEIGDLLRIKIIVNDVMECYKVLGIIHSIFKPVNGKFKDYISNPKTNKYQSLHTTVYTNTNLLAQIQIRTKEMNKIDTLGIINAWYKKEDAGDIKKYLYDNFPFIAVLKEIDDHYPNDLEFMEKLRYDILKERIYIVIGNGNIMELPYGSTINDLCRKLGICGKNLIINNEEKEGTYILKNNDFVSLEKVKVKKL